MKTRVRDLVERIEQLEAGLERMLLAVRNDLAALREELLQLEPESTRPTKPPASIQNAGARAPASGPKRTLSEELALRKKTRDPRTDD